MSVCAPSRGCWPKRPGPDGLGLAAQSGRSRVLAARWPVRLVPLAALSVGTSRTDASTTDDPLPLFRRRVGGPPGPARSAARSAPVLRLDQPVFLAHRTRLHRDRRKALTTTPTMRARADLGLGPDATERVGRD